MGMSPIGGRQGRRMAGEDPQVDVVLSRPAYRQGGTLVGTVQVRTADDASPRDVVRSLDLCALGRCRLDSRWHNIKDYRDIQLVAKNALLWGLEHDVQSVCFWATQPVDVMQYQERTAGRWDDVKPRKIQLDGEDDTTGTSLGEIALEDRRLAFSFQVQLPTTLPHSMLGTSCRYYYVIVIKLLLKSRKKAQWLETPFLVLTKHPDLVDIIADDPVSLSHFRITPCNVLVHSSGLPCGVTAAELNHPGGVLTVNRHGASHYRHIQREDPKHLQTLRVAEPSGGPVCVLTIIGASVLHPGSRVVLKFDFPSTRNWVPCHQVSACLQGEEIAIRKNGSCKRARSHLFSTAHEYVDPQCTDQIALHLLLPLDAPCTIKTDAVLVSVRCLVDISVENQGKSGTFQNLRLEIPCEVTHSVAAYERDEDDDSRLREKLSIDELLGRPDNGEQFDDPAHPASFKSAGIFDELRILSLRMAHDCGLYPVAPIEKTKQ